MARFQAKLILSNIITIKITGDTFPFLESPSHKTMKKNY